jgi:cytochrome c oxidase subunit 2
MSLKNILAGVTALLCLFAAVSADALAGGQPVPWQVGFQDAASPLMAEINSFHNMLLVIISVIALFVLGLLLYVMVRFNAKANPTPSQTTHNTVLEVLWTVVPIVILTLIAIPSFKLLYYQNTIPESDMTIKAIGSQWYWTYEYPDEGFEFDALPVDKADIGPDQIYLLSADNDIVVPVGKIVRVIVTANSVIHAFAVPSLGVKIDAVPGRLNETWFYINEPGMYYGQCSEICGTGHSFMPIAIRAVSQADYDAWLTTARAEFASIESPMRVAGTAAE